MSLEQISSCDFALTTREEYSFLRHPTKFNYYGENWSVGCSPHILVMVKDDAEYPTVNQFGSSNFNKFLSWPCQSLGTKLIADLKEWAGDPMWAAPCEYCEAQGCAWCDMTGKTDPIYQEVLKGERWGNVGGHIFNTILFARALSVAPDQETSAVFITESAAKLVAPSFIAIVMRIGSKPSEVDNAKQLIFDTVEEVA